MDKGTHVVIIGGGFGGLSAARALHDAPVHVTLVDRRNFHLFQPLLYQVATGLLSPSEVTTPLRHILKDQKNARVLLGEVVDFDLEQRRVLLADGEIPYDTLIVAAGMENDYFGHDDWRTYAPGLKTMEDAAAIRQKIFSAFEVAERETDPAARQAWLTFAVIGGGSTGIELTGMIAEICRSALKGEFRAIRPEAAQVLLIEAGGRILPAYSESLSQKARHALDRQGVRTLVNTRVIDIGAEGFTIEQAGGRTAIAARTVLWSTGVKAAGLAHTLAARTGAQTDRLGRILVGPDLCLPGYPDIRIIGDMAHFPGKHGPLPGLAPAATQQGRYAARAISAGVQGRAQTGPFRFFDKGMLSVIGRHAAVADIGGLRFSGLAAWLLWLFVHLVLLINFENRLIVLTRWAFQYLVFSRGGRQLCQSGTLRLPLSGTGTPAKFPPGCD